MSVAGIDLSPTSALIARWHDGRVEHLEARDMRQAWKAAQNQWGQLEAAVLTAPAGGHPGERRRLLRHARQAGVEVLRIISAPAAAAFGHLQASGQSGTWAVLDLRRATFDCCVVALDAQRVEVLAAIGFTDLGADAVDAALVHVLANEFMVPERDASALRMHARQAREGLSGEFAVAIDARLPSGKRVRRRLTRHQMRAYAEVVRDRWMAACRRAMAEAETIPAWLDGVLVLGFAPMLNNVVRRCFHRPPVRLGATGAAGGAARYALRLTGEADGPLVFERSTHGLALEARDGSWRGVLPAGTPIPASVACTPRKGERLIHLDWRDTIVGVEQLARGPAELLLDADGVVHVDQDDPTNGSSRAVGR